jgi:hypothetical protein
VTFRKRFTARGKPADDPKSLVDPGDGVIDDETFVEILEPAGLDVTEDLNEGSGSENGNDNGFFGLGTETWVYDVAEGREQEFIHALVASRVVLDFEELSE